MAFDALAYGPYSSNKQQPYSYKYEHCLHHVLLSIAIHFPNALLQVPSFHRQVNDSQIAGVSSPFATTSLSNQSFLLGDDLLTFASYDANSLVSVVLKCCDAILVAMLQLRVYHTTIKLLKVCCNKYCVIQCLRVLCCCSHYY